MKSILIVDDDMVFCEVLSHMLEGKNFEVMAAHHAEEALENARNFQPEYALIDLKMPGDSGLTLIPKLLSIDPYTKIVVLTGFATIATAIEAIKLGALHYLAKPVGVDDIIDAFDRHEGNPLTPIEPQLRTLHRINQEHIRTVLERNHFNISATARELGMHRRTLQRKLDKK